MGGAGGWGMGCQWLAGLVLGVVFKIGEIKIASSDNSGGLVVAMGSRVWNHGRRVQILL